MKSLIRRSAAVALTAACWATASQALACKAPPYGTPLRSVTVHTSDLDLANERGNRILKRRIRRAAGRVCLAPGGDHLWARYGDCYRRSVDDAEDQIRFLPTPGRNRAAMP